MKKSLIALAVLSTIAGSAAAQSSVSVYGRIDMGYRDFSTTTAAATSVKTDTAQITSSQFTNARLGFMGTEDLGGGLKASFVAEGNLLDAPGTTGSNNTSAFNFGRQLHVTLSSAKSGSLLLGKTDALVKNVFDGFDAGYANNLTGAYDGMGTSLTEISGSNVIGSRRDQVIRYTTPTFSGFNVSAGLIKSEVESTAATAGASSEEAGYELGATYVAGKLSLAGAYRTADTKANAVAGVIGQCMINSSGLLNGTATASACADGETRVTGANPVAAVNNTTNSMAFGASYNFGSVIGYAQYFDQEVKANAAGTKVSEDAMTLGLRVPMGKSTLFASYTDGSATSATNVKTNFEGMQAGVKYDLSKRTYGYVAYGESELQATGGAKAKAENLALGIVHSF
jgi:predicted porin